MNHKLFVPLSLMLVALLVAACAQQSPATEDPVTPNADAGPTTSHGGPVEDCVSLVDTLRAAGANVEPGGSVEQAFFTATGQILKVNNKDLQVFEYESAKAMETEAAQVAPDGGSVGTSMMVWVEAPHFFKSGRVLVLYVGEEQEVIDLLSDALGEQFAGR